MLVSALAGREHILRAYEEAVRLRYRFFSFGDAMLIRGRARRETVSTDARTDDRTDATAHGGDTETANANAESADDTGTVADDDAVCRTAEEILREHHAAFKELAK